MQLQWNKALSSCALLPVCFLTICWWASERWSYSARDVWLISAMSVKCQLEPDDFSSLNRNKPPSVHHDDWPAFLFCYCSFNRYPRVRFYIIDRGCVHVVEFTIVNLLLQNSKRWKLVNVFIKKHSYPIDHQQVEVETHIQLSIDTICALGQLKNK